MLWTPKHSWPRGLSLELSRRVPGNACEQGRGCYRHWWKKPRPVPGEEGGRATGIKPLKPALYLTDALVNRRCWSKCLKGTFLCLSNSVPVGSAGVKVSDKTQMPIYPGKMKTLIQKDTCTPVFIAALSTTAKTWTQPVSINRWLV